ncbi:MAG: PAS domain S-box protein, partial [Actinomycetota bacterium]
MQLDCQAVLDSLADAVVAANEDGEIFYVNRAAGRLLGWTSDELIGQPLTVIIPARLRQAHLIGINRYLATRQPRLLGRPVRVPALRKDGVEVEVELTLAAYHQHGRMAFVGAIRDLSERVELERQLTISRYLRAATATAARLTSHLTVDEVLQAVVEMLVADFDGALARIWLCNSETGALELKASAGAPSAQAAGSLASILPETFPYEVGEVTRGGKAFVQSPHFDDPKFDQEWVKREGLVSAVAFPLICGDELLGAFVYFARKELHPEVVQVLETFASITTTALNDAQLLVREQAARAEAERLRAEAEKERDFVRRVVEYSPLGIAVTEGDEHRFTLINPAGARMLGLTIEQVVGRSTSELALETDEEWRRLVGGVLSGGELVVFPELAVRLPDGRVLYTHVAYAPLLGPDGAPSGMIHLALDITERKLAEEALRRQAHLLATVEQAIVVTDPSGDITYWNNYAERMFGWRAGEVLGRSILEVTPTEQSRDQSEAILKQLLSGKSWAGECLLQRRDGSTFPGWVTDTPIRDAAGEVTGIIGVTSDLTELKGAEAELRYQRELLRTITENADSALIMMDVEGHIEYVNPAFTRITGYTEADISGVTLHDALHYKHPDGRPLPKEECPIVHAYTHLEPIRGLQANCSGPNASARR